MFENHPSISMLEKVAEALADLNDEIVYVGGATVPLYIEDPGSQEPRPTTDVDCIVEIGTYQEYTELEKRLLAVNYPHLKEGACGATCKGN